MSQLIDANRALDAVKKCCGDVVPQSKVVNAIDRAIKFLSPPLESRALAPKLPWGQIWGFWLGAKRAPADPLKAVVVPGRTVGPESQLLQDLKQLRAEAQQLDPCNVLVGCCAREFRKLALPQGKSGQGDRIRYVELDWARKFFAVQPQKIPKLRSRFVRQEK